MSQHEPKSQTSAAAANTVVTAASVRLAGYCVLCDCIVERASSGACPGGHPATAVTGRIVLEAGEPIPQLPRFNLAAFLIPPIWGPAHGQWAGAIFLPLWLFADSVFRTAGQGVMTGVAAVIVGGSTVGAMAWFGKRANGLAWRRQWNRVSVAEYVRRERVWSIVAVPVAAALASLALYFDIVVLPARGL